MIRSALACVVAFSMFAVSVGAQQTAYPVRTLRLIASQSPGGGIDVVSRVVATRLSDTIGQTVIVDNRPGANGSVAAELTAKSPPDGYVFMLGAIGNLATNAFFYKKLGYDPLKDLAPITGAVTGGQVLVVHPSVPVRSVKELVALARSRPGQLAYATSGTGGSGHLAGALFQRLAHITLLHVPYKGGAPAMVDLMAGNAQIGFPAPATVHTFIQQGKLRALAMGTAKRSKIYPQLPTIAEAGVPGYEASSWYGFVTAAKTPPEIVGRLSREIGQALHTPEASAALLNLGMEIWTTTPEALGAHMKAEHEKWGRVIRAEGITER
jgi:tripartite-type tricarboxylate transporter receptor subunit TctC